MLPHLARRARVIAAPSELLAAITSAAKREGARVHYHAGPSSFLCHACGAVTAVKDRGELYFVCGGCGRTNDQDENAARVLLAAAVASAPVATETPLPLAWQKRLASKGLRQRRQKGSEDGGTAEGSARDQAKITGVSNDL